MPQVNQQYLVLVILWKISFGPLFKATSSGGKILHKGH